ncbi:MAG: phosphotransferase [Rhodobacteraceae bacterium]|nr:phosphotransferase [Paracoccaceae bacterium]
MSIERIRALPCWQGDVAAEPLHGGLSNEIWKVTDGRGDHVVRFGQDYPFHHVFRDREAMTARAAARAGFAPEVEFTAPGVMVTRFLAARTWSAADLAGNPARVAGLLREFHGRMGAQIEGAPYFFWPFQVVRDYARSLKAGGSPHVADLPRLLALTAAAEALQVPMPVVFGHNDLLPANFLETADGRLWLIDFEYAGFGTAMFDLAGAASNAGMDDAQAGALVTAYLGGEPDAATRRAFDAMCVAALVREAMWAMVSALHLNAPGVDYAAYAAENLARLRSAVARFNARYGSLA